MIIPRSEVIELDMNVEEALKYIVSMGTVSPISAASGLTTAQLSKSSDS
jgi:uncharacterized membrane protein